MSNTKYLSVLTDRLLPEYIREEYSKFETFIKKYLEYTEQAGEITNLISDFLHFIDIDKLDPYSVNDNKILEQYIKQYLSSFPLYRIQDIDPKKLIKNAKDFYSCKGTERSYEFLFRLLNHAGSFSFYYPSQDILRISDAYDGILSDNKYIHDNFYRAYFTYEIQSSLFGYSELKDIITNVLHPVGCKCFFLRKIESDAYDAYSAYSAEGAYVCFYFYADLLQYGSHGTYSKIYNNGLWTFEDVEKSAYDPTLPFLIGQMNLYDWGDTFNNFESVYGTENDNFFEHQLSCEVILL